MATRQYASEAETTEVLKEVLWLAWQACGGPIGRGFFQDNPDAKRDDVFTRTYGEGDYASRRADRNDLHADYVFGRMMKLYIQRPKSDTVVVHDATPRIDYQGWCGKYPTYAALFDAAEKNVITKQAA
jgi:hypothetical protein